VLEPRGVDAATAEARADVLGLLVGARQRPAAAVARRDDQARAQRDALARGDARPAVPAAHGELDAQRLAGLHSVGGAALRDHELPGDARLVGDDVQVARRAARVVQLPERLLEQRRRGVVELDPGAAQRGEPRGAPGVGREEALHGALDQRLAVRRQPPRLSRALERDERRGDADLEAAPVVLHRDDLHRQVRRRGPGVDLDGRRGRGRGRRRWGQACERHGRADASARAAVVGERRRDDGLLARRGRRLHREPERHGLGARLVSAQRQPLHRSVDHDEVAGGDEPYIQRDLLHAGGDADDEVFHLLVLPCRAAIEVYDGIEQHAGSDLAR
jgi:hypothetical protein